MILIKQYFFQLLHDSKLSKPPMISNFQLVKVASEVIFLSFQTKLNATVFPEVKERSKALRGTQKRQLLLPNDTLKGADASARCLHALE